MLKNDVRTCSRAHTLTHALTLFHVSLLRSVFRRRGCRSVAFKKAGMRKETKAEMPKVLARGEEHGKFLNSRPNNNVGGFERVSDSLDD